MTTDKKRQRREEIENAALSLLEEKGYAQTSILMIARRAKASNETLYNWYGDKLSLFRSLVMRNADGVRELLQQALGAGSDPMQTLVRIGPLLLGLLTGDRAVALNRAAAADPSGELGAALSEAGRETILPMIANVLERARDTGALGFDNTGAAAELYLNLLIGDLQIRRVIGRQPPLSEAQVKARAARALDNLQTLLPPP